MKIGKIRNFRKNSNLFRKVEYKNYVYFRALFKSSFLGMFNEFDVLFNCLFSSYFDQN